MNANISPCFQLSGWLMTALLSVFVWTRDRMLSFCVFSGSQRQTHPRGENLSKDPVQEMRIYWRIALRLSTNFTVTRHLSASAETALH